MTKTTLSLKKLCMVFALTVLLLPQLATSVSAKQEWVELDGIIGGKIQYDTDSGYIINCDEGVTSANIPSEIDGVDIVGINKGAFMGCNLLESVYIPDSVVDFQDGNNLNFGIFRNCTALTSVRLPYGMDTIPVAMFYGCSALPATGVAIPTSVTHISEYAFYGCKSLTTLDIPDSVETMGVHCFSGCSSLTNISFPENLTAIPSYSFSNCPALSVVYIPLSLVKVGTNAFVNSTELSEIYYAGTANQWKAIVIDNYNAPLNQSVVIYNSSRPEGVTASFSSWATDFVLTASKKQLLTSSLGEDYTETITRAQIAELFVNLVEKSAQTTLPYADQGTFSDTSDLSILKAYEAGIVSGTGADKFSPNNLATREQIAIMLYKAIQVIESHTGKALVDDDSKLSTIYTDLSEVSDWALEAVGILANNNIMTGTSGSRLSPKDNTTIEQSIVLALGVYNK